MSADLLIRPLGTMPEFAACERLHEHVWGLSERDLVPRRLFMVAHKIGGLTLGAWDGEHLAGFTLALPAHRAGQLYWHSNMLAVDEEYRNRGLGRRLKLRQREAAIEQGIDLIEWTFDPLEAKNAYFNLEVLGATAGVMVRRYHPDLYGLTSSALQAGLPTDRMVAEWRLRSLKAVASTPVLRVRVPAEVSVWKATRDPRAAELQLRNREALAAAFAQGLAVVGFERHPSGGGAYLLGVL